MATIAIYCVDAELRRQREALVRANAAFTVIGAVAADAALRSLLEQHAVDVVLADAPPPELMFDWHERFGGTALVVVLADADAEGLDALAAGAHAVLPRSASGSDIIAAMIAAPSGLSVLPRPLLATLLAGSAIEASASQEMVDATPLTPRELEVLTAMADGASNKSIARRLGISHHTVKFHVAAILAKLDADSRTEAVARAAHLGLVML